MNDFNTTIKCPTCNDDVIINTQQLLMGAKFVCQSCKTSIGLGNDNESKKKVENAMNELINIKSKAK